MVKTQNKDKI